MFARGLDHDLNALWTRLQMHELIGFLVLPCGPQLPDVVLEGLKRREAVGRVFEWWRL